MALISTTEAAHRLNAKPDTIQKMCKQGRIPAQFIAGRYLIDDAILDSIIISKKGWPKGRARTDSPSPSALSHRKRRK